MPKFSFIVTCYNLADYIEACIESILAQADEHEIIVIDDGSTDESPTKLASYLNHPNIVLIRTANQGLEKACNLGLRAARNPWVVRVDGDDMLSAGYVSAMQSALKTHTADFYYCQSVIDVYPKTRTQRTLPAFDRDEVFDRGDFFATGTLYRRADVLAVGGYDETLKNCGLENYTLILRLLTLGKSGYAVPKACFEYRRHDNNMSTLSRDKIRHVGQALLARYNRHYRTNQYHPYGLTLD